LCYTDHIIIDGTREKEVVRVTVWGLLLIAATCLVAVTIGAIANRNVRSFNEEAHESFLGSVKEGDVVDDQQIS